MPSWLSLGFQDSNSFVMLELTKLHDHIMVVMVMVVVLVVYMLFYLFLGKNYYKYLSEGTLIETVWSIVPASLLVILVVPSMKVLYLMEDNSSPTISIKVIGHQWYWTYVFNLLQDSVKDSSISILPYNSQDSILGLDTPRLLSCDKDLILPMGETCRFLVSSSDVIHAFSIPSMGLKVDALPGRVNQVFATPVQQGHYFGQCSEICGSYHSFMPISIKVVTLPYYNNLLYTFSMDNLLEFVKDSQY